MLSDCPRINGVTVVYLSHVLSGANDAGELGMLYRGLDSVSWTAGEVTGNNRSGMCVQVRQPLYVFHMCALELACLRRRGKNLRFCGGACEREVVWAAPFQAVRQGSVLCMAGVRPRHTCIVIHPSKKLWKLWKCVQKADARSVPKLLTWDGRLLAKVVGSIQHNREPYICVRSTPRYPKCSNPTRSIPTTVSC